MAGCAGGAAAVEGLLAFMSFGCDVFLESHLLAIFADGATALGEVGGTDCAGGGREVWLLVWGGGCDCCLEGAVDVVGCLGEG